MRYGKNTPWNHRLKKQLWRRNRFPEMHRGTEIPQLIFSSDKTSDFRQKKNNCFSLALPWKRRKNFGFFHSPFAECTNESYGTLGTKLRESVAGRAPSAAGRKAGAMYFVEIGSRIAKFVFRTECIRNG